jgi:hypothetical protein
VTSVRGGSVTRCGGRLSCRTLPPIIYARQAVAYALGVAVSFLYWARGLRGYRPNRRGYRPNCLTCYMYRVALSV